MNTRLIQFTMPLLLGLAGLYSGCGTTAQSDTHHGDSGLFGTGGSATGDAALSLLVGSACSAQSVCPPGGSGDPTCLTDWPGGYCVVKNCATHGHDCPGDPGQAAVSPTVGAICVLSPDAVCLALCATSGDCRSGYVCEPRNDAAGHGTATVCVPSTAGTAPMDGGQTSDMPGNTSTDAGSMM